MRGWVLRTHIEGHRAPAGTDLRLFRYRCTGCLEDCGLFSHARLLVLIAVLVPVDRIVLPEGIARPAVGHHNPAELGMVSENDPEEIENFTLVPVGGAPGRCDGIDFR